MIAPLAAARALLREYSEALVLLRAEHQLSIRALAQEVDVAASTLSQIETCKRLPTEDEANRIEQWMTAHSHLHLFGGDQYKALESGSARSTDPAQSHATVRSIDSDMTMADRIISLAREWYPLPFNDTDLRDAFEERWPRSYSQRPWQRNVIAKARVNLHSHQTLGDDGRKVRVETPDAVLKRSESIERPDQEQSLPTAHFIYQTETERES